MRHLGEQGGPSSLPCSYGPRAGIWGHSTQHASPVESRHQSLSAQITALESSGAGAWTSPGCSMDPSAHASAIPPYIQHSAIGKLYRLNPSIHPSTAVSGCQNLWRVVTGQNLFSIANSSESWKDSDLLLFLSLLRNLVLALSRSACSCRTCRHCA